eukprot:TRINITY_DN10497_c0_g1_i1.p1 TRINITY_DN10497_c0_g1~~TRINITY_DN10497_c0_g1_i1.p1  ORF type:complete len:254 (+),score=69.46 TRINITY_DN10497_c0_g1_i1:90-851(+)
MALRAESLQRPAAEPQPQQQADPPAAHADPRPAAAVLALALSAVAAAGVGAYQQPAAAAPVAPATCGLGRLVMPDDVGAGVREHTASVLRLWSTCRRPVILHVLGANASAVAAVAAAAAAAAGEVRSVRGADFVRSAEASYSGCGAVLLRDWGEVVLRARDDSAKKLADAAAGLPGLRHDTHNHCHSLLVVTTVREKLGSWLLCPQRVRDRGLGTALEAGDVDAVASLARRYGRMEAVWPDDLEHTVQHVGVY